MGHVLEGGILFYWFIYHGGLVDLTEDYARRIFIRPDPLFSNTYDFFRIGRRGSLKARETGVQL